MVVLIVQESQETAFGLRDIRLPPNKNCPVRVQVAQTALVMIARSGNLVPRRTLRLPRGAQLLHREGPSGKVTPLRIQQTKIDIQQPPRGPALHPPKSTPVTVLVETEKEEGFDLRPRHQDVCPKVPTCTENETTSTDQESEKLKRGGLAQRLYHQNGPRAMTAYPY
jgi:hypothetical protein